MNTMLDAVVDAKKEDTFMDVENTVEGVDTVTRMETALIVSQSVKPSAQTTILQPHLQI